MKATKVYLENRTNVPLYANVRAENGVMTITLYRLPMAGSEHIPAGKAATYAVNDALKRCFKGGRLEYEIVNRTKMSIVFDGGREKLRDGPILKIEQLPD